MKIGMITDSLADMELEALLRTSAALGIERLEFAGGNWSRAPHLKLDLLLENESARREFLAKLRDHGIALSALNCSGNPLHPGEHGQRHREVTQKTIKLASLLGVARVVMMSGCPGGPGDVNANWVTTSWPPEMQAILRYQWEEVLIPYWRDLVAYANGLGIHKLCLELHGHQNVYSVETFRRLRDAVGETVGVNFDPSHLMWMGADPLAAIPALDGAIYHVHAKDTRIDPEIAGLNGRIEVKSGDLADRRAWNYVTLGLGHEEAWWRKFCAALRAVGYDDVLSIEHEDVSMTPLEGVRRSVELLKRAIPS
ncbi:MAG TPA: sugar phosphate isomerase/epimerase [Stellaceae bacterium]|nr:sugar phosphate isomerase/epimerase [Stellaceae bacterium]